MWSEWAGVLFTDTPRVVVFRVKNKTKKKGTEHESASAHFQYAMFKKKPQTKVEIRVCWRTPSRV